MRNYKRKTTRQTWDTLQMKKAIEAVNKGQMGIRKAAQSYSVPKSTLEDRLKKLRTGKLSMESAALKGMD